MVTEFYDTRYLNKLINPQLVTFSNYSESKNFRRNFSANIQNHLLLRTNFTPSNRRRSNYYVTSYKSLPISQRNPKKFILLTQTFLTKYQNWWKDIRRVNIDYLVDDEMNLSYQDFVDNSPLFKPYSFTTNFFLNHQYAVVTKFYRLYSLLVLRNLSKFGLFMHYLSKRERTHAHIIYFTFNRTRLYINLWDKKRRNYVSLSVGLFVKFFEKKRSLKKNRMFRFLLVRFFRKLLIVSGIKNVLIVCKKTPRDLPEIFNFLCRPLRAPFFDPIKGQIITESPDKYHRFDMRYLHFCQSVSFTSMKFRKKGRLKRKISRKVIKQNRMSD
jgi:hypothetical protein